MNFKTPYDIVYDEIIQAAYTTPPLHAEEVYDLLMGKPEVIKSVQALSLSEMYDLDMLFFNQGGRFLMDVHQRPYETSFVRVNGIVLRVIKTALFTFDAEPINASNDDFV